jgi:GTP cyclohydrolase I
MNKGKICEGVRLILEGLGDDLHREGLINTPERVADVYLEIMSSTNKECQTIKTIKGNNQDQIIVVKNIPFYSLCEHHLLPFFGQAHLAYLSRNDKIAGFSSLATVVEHYSKRLQIQERLTNQIADKLLKDLDAKGVAVVLEAHQMCISMRTRKGDNIKTITRAARGDITLESSIFQSIFLTAT